MKLNNLLLMPPGGWKYLQPETGFWVSGITFGQLLGRIVAHRSNNNLPAVAPTFNTLEDEIQDWLCQRLIPQDQVALCTDAPPLPWPAYLQPLRLLAKEGDRGLGDIAARIIGPLGGDAFKDWYKATFGQDCGCYDRQIRLNVRYPL